MAKVFVTRKLPGSALDRLATLHDVDVWSEDAPITREALVFGASEAEGLICMLTDPIDADLIEQLPKLRAISTYAVGYNNIDIEAATARGIAVGHTPDVLTEATADIAFALMLAAARKIAVGDRVVRNEGWPDWSPTTLLGHDIHGRTLGIVGYGRIGKAVARRARGFGMRVVYSGRVGSAATDRNVGVDEDAASRRDWLSNMLRSGAEAGARAGTRGRIDIDLSNKSEHDPEAERFALDELLQISDFVSLHCRLTEQTKWLINERALSLMKPSAYLINTARGEVVEQDALVHALNEGWIAGAALDVTDPEPLPADSSLLECQNLTITPHLGSGTLECRAEMTDLAVDNLLAGLAGEPLPAAVTA